MAETKTKMSTGELMQSARQMRNVFRAFEHAVEVAEQVHTFEASFNSQKSLTAKARNEAAAAKTELEAIRGDVTEATSDAEKVHKDLGAAQKELIVVQKEIAKQRKEFEQQTAELEVDYNRVKSRVASSVDKDRKELNAKFEKDRTALQAQLDEMDAELKRLEIRREEMIADLEARLAQFRK